MNQTEDGIITLAKKEINELTKVNRIFLDNFPAKAVSGDVHNKLELEDDKLSCTIFGHKASTTPRVIKVGNEFYMEYVFLIAFNDKYHEVTRFYVDNSGSFLDGLESKIKIFDYNDEKIVINLYSRIAIGILNSPAFAMTENLQDQAVGLSINTD